MERGSIIQVADSPGIWIKGELNLLTGLNYDKSFFERVIDFFEDYNPKNYCMAAIDIEHFRLFNKLYGRDEGDKLLKNIGNLLSDFCEENSCVAGYLGGDNFAVLMPYDEALIRKLRHGMNHVIKEWNNTVGFLPAIGIYVINENDEIRPMAMYDRATVASSHVIGNYANRICVYTPDMDEKLEEEIRLLSDVQRGLTEGEFTFYIQPQCDISTGKIVGGESLVRWKHSEKGMISPGVFVPVLEKNGFIADLDRYIWDKVCMWLRGLIDKGYEPVPISINVSRIDVFSMDVPDYLKKLMDKYQLPTRLLKVEITESAYAENNDKLVRTVTQLRDMDFLVMMDDFGSGYSSLNMLKSVAVDVLKIDMRFLEIDENEQEKGIGILESVVGMAKQMRIPIIVEGVETQLQENFLMKMGCRYTQGYYYYKPMPIDDFEKLLGDKRNLDLNGFWCRQVDSLHLKEFLDPSLFNDNMVNNILGPAAFYDMYENNVEIVRVNEQYLKMAGIPINVEDEDCYKRFWNHVRDDDRQLLSSIFIQSHLNQTEGAQGYIHFIRNDGEVLWIQIKVFFLREKGGHKLFYASLSDMTEIHNNRKSGLGSLSNIVDEMSIEEIKELDKYYGDLPCGFGVIKLTVDENDKPVDYDFVYANKEVNKTSGGDIERLRYMVSKTFLSKQEELYELAYRAAYLGETVKYNAYSGLSCRYLELVLYPYKSGYVKFMLNDATRPQIYENILDNVLRTYRAVYYLDVQNKYSRMVYPDDNHLLERGNHYEILNRHFENGTIRPEDEENVRKFFDVDNIRRELMNKPSIEYKYRRMATERNEEWCLTTFAVSERTEDGVPKTVIITIRSIESMMREKQMKRRQLMTMMLTSIEEGFFVYQAESEKVTYANPAVIKMFGCDSLEDFIAHIGGSFKGMVHPDDYKRIQWEINDQVGESDRKMDYITYRIVRKDGGIRWVDDCGHLVVTSVNEEDKLFYVLLSDATDELNYERKLELVELSEKMNS